MNISSLVITTAPQHLQQVVKSLENSGLCEIHFIDEKGKIIVTIEGENVSEEVSKVKEIEQMQDEGICADEIDYQGDLKGKL